jgi:hypothetical protein
MNFWIKISLFIFINSFIGAYLSKLIKDQTIPWYCTVITGAISGLIWGYMTTSNKNMIYLSVVFDVLTALTYISVFLILGDKLTEVQIIGIIMSVLGIALISGL